MTDAAPKPVTLSSRIRDFLAPPRFAVVATIGAAGAPHQTVLWYDVEGDSILLNGVRHRHWCANVERDPRVTIVVHDGYDYVELRGRAEEQPGRERGLADIERLARRYLQDPARVEESMTRYRDMERVSFLFRPSRVRERFGEG